MTVEELMQWDTYDRQYLLPNKRLELYLAQLTLHVATLGTAWGGPKYTISDFLLDERLDSQRKTTPVEEGAEAIANAGGVKVYKLGQRKKRGGSG